MSHCPISLLAYRTPRANVLPHLGPTEFGRKQKTERRDMALWQGLYNYHFTHVFNSNTHIDMQCNFLHQVHVYGEFDIKIQYDVTKLSGFTVRFIQLDV